MRGAALEPAAERAMTTAACAFLERAARHPDRVAYRTLAAGGAPRDETLTWGEWAEASRRFAAALLADGLRPGEAVAILAGTGTLWPIADLGVLLAGGVSEIGRASCRGRGGWPVACRGSQTGSG